MIKISLTVLGSSAGMPQANRINAGYVLDVEGKLIQLDCGGGVAAAFRRAGCDPGAVERIVISHGHPDHLSDLPLFVQMLYLSGRREVLSIHLPVELVEPIQQYFRAVYLLPEKLPFDIRFEPLDPATRIKSDCITIIPIPNKHLGGYQAIISNHHLFNRMESYSLLIQIDTNSILYSADLGSEADLLPHLDNLDLLLVESTHIDVARLLGVAAEKRVGRVVLTHFEEDYDLKAALALGQKAGVTNLCLAHDGMRIVL